MSPIIFAISFAVSNLVDPFWGSGGTASAPSEGMSRGWNWEKAQTGNTFPGAVRPFGWVSVCGYSGGYSSGYGRFGCSGEGPAPEKTKELKLFGFTHFHHNGAGWIGSFQNYVLMQPFAGTPDLTRASSVRGETASPGYYAAGLPDYGAQFELTADRFAACHRYAFAKDGGRVRIDFTQAGYRREIFDGRPTYAESIGDYVINATAEGEWSGFLVIGGLKRYFALRTKGAVGERTDGVLTLSFAGRTAETVIGFSDESVEEAVIRARAAERSGFEAVRESAAVEWEDLLGGIRVEFAQESDARRFYSALYQSCIKPVEYRPGRFVEFATTWDAYRTQLPLVLSLCPKFARPLALSMLKTSEEVGYFPNCYLRQKRLSHNDVQASALGAYVMADACFRGLLGKSEYPRVKAFFEREFRTTDISKRSLSHALDLGGAYHAAAEVARMNGDAATAAEWESSAAVWKSAYDPATGLLRRSDNFYEGSEKNYSFRPHVGMAERIALAGGREKFERMLEDFFAVGADFPCWTPKEDRLPRPGRFEGLNNEADMDAPLCWFWIGRSDRVAEVHDLVRRCRFADGEGGLPGNNDGGGTSSWYVWSCLGLRPFAGTPYVFLVSPTVVRADIPFGAGRLSIAVERENAKSIYPADYVFNGRELREPWLPVADLVKGGRLVFRLADKPAGKSFVPDWL